MVDSQRVPNHRDLHVYLLIITRHILEMSAIGLHEIRGRAALLVKAKVKPSMAADIWSDSAISLMPSMPYFIDEDWTQIHEVLLNCTGFTGDRHTGEAIRQQTVEDLDRVGLTFNYIHAKVSDQGSNIKKAWGGLPGGYCARHTLEPSVKVNLKSPGVCQGWYNTVRVMYRIVPIQYCNVTYRIVS